MFQMSQILDLKEQMELPEDCSLELDQWILLADTK